MAKILIVDDDEALSEMLASLLLIQKHVVEQVYDGAAALERVFAYKYDLIIVDWRLPKISGIEACKQIKMKHPTLPVLMLTSNMRLEDKEEGLEAGADDYVTKPIETIEFAARVRALLRRAQAEQESKMQYKDVVLDIASGRCTRGHRQIALAKKEVELLEALISQTQSRIPAEAVMSTEALMSKLWGKDGTRAGLANCLKRLRSKLMEAGEPDLIETLPGTGYRLK